MKKYSEAQSLLEKAIQAYSSKDFQTAHEIFESICALYPHNWSARYFFAMNLCAIGDFSESRAELQYIEAHANDAIWEHVSRSGIILVNNKENYVRMALENLLA